MYFSASHFRKSLFADKFFWWIKKDIEMLDNSYDCIVMFGIDKNLKNSVRIEQTAEKDTVESSVLDLEKISECLNFNGVKNYI